MTISRCPSLRLWSRARHRRERSAGLGFDVAKDCKELWGRLVTKIKVQMIYLKKIYEGRSGNKWGSTCYERLRALALWSAKKR